MLNLEPTIYGYLWYKLLHSSNSISHNQNYCSELINPSFSNIPCLSYSNQGFLSNIQRVAIRSENIPSMYIFICYVKTNNNIEELIISYYFSTDQYMTTLIRVTYKKKLPTQ